MMLRIAACQAKLQCEDVSANINHTLELINTATDSGAELVVLPELANSGYKFKSKEELTDVISGTDAVSEWREKSAQKRCVIIAGYSEVEGGAAYNRSIIIDNGKIVHTYTKLHLWNTEKDIFTPGVKAPEVIQTSVGRITTLICYDMEFPELVRILALQGAQLIAAPVNWPSNFQSQNSQGAFSAELVRVMAAASTNRIWVAVADRSGLERGTDWLESSAVVDPNGWPISMVGKGSGVALADIDMNEADNKRISPNNNVFEDRRPEFY